MQSPSYCSITNASRYRGFRMAVSLYLKWFLIKLRFNNLVLQKVYFVFCKCSLSSTRTMHRELKLYRFCLNTNYNSYIVSSCPNILHYNSRTLDLNLFIFRGPYSFIAFCSAKLYTLYM